MTLQTATTPLANAPQARQDVEVHAIERQQRRFGVISLLAIVVSFVHMGAALTLFSGPSWYEVGAALAMTALVDVATWAIAEYHHYAQRRRLARSRWVQVLFGVALAISMTLNGAYLHAHRPAPADLPEWLSIGVAVAFALFVPMLIGVAALVRGELEDDRLRVQQQASIVVQERAELEQLRDDYERLREDRLALVADRQRLLTDAHDVAQLRAELAQQEARVAQSEQERAQFADEAAQFRAVLAQAAQDIAQRDDALALARAEGARQEGLLAQIRAELARVQEERAQVAQPGELDVLAIARRLRDLGVPSREAAQLVGMAESTLRNRLKQAEAA
ncbi:MAG: hypothetical protein RLZZ387_5061 [Chloroflexota bacterium]|jgi:hypothetical protein